MPRKERGQRKFETYTHPKLQEEVQIYVLTLPVHNHGGRDYRTGSFKAEYAGTTIIRPTLSELRTDLEKHIAACNLLNWIPVINVTILQSDDRAFKKAPEIKLEYSRYWVAQRPDMQWMEVGWDIKTENRIRVAVGLRHRHPAPDTLPANKVIQNYSGPNSITYALPYNDQLWDSLGWLSDQIIAIQKLINQTIGTEKGLAQLMTNAQKVLPMLNPVMIPDSFREDFKGDPDWHKTGDRHPE